jgi:hypothetical protein
MANRSIRKLLFAVVMMLALSAASYAQGFAFSVSFGPPPLPVYEQPLCPGEGYIWTPGYWSYDNDYDDYYWVPGTWVLAPEVGFFWTPGYWAWNGVSFVFYDGYWGPTVGFYGGINYGFGYFGEGFVGGRWDNGRFFYNRSVTNVNVTVIRNVYNTTVVNRTENRVSFNGGNGGVNARPTREQEAAAHERHIAPVAAQTQHIQAARSNPELRASANRGKPPIAATAKPGAFSGREVVAAKQAGGSYKPPANRPGGQPRENTSAPRSDRPSGAVHPKDLPPRERPAPQSSGNSRQDQKYQQQQEKLNARQDQERQKLQQKQEQEHQRMDRQRADDSKKQQVEQRHQQQTQQLQQRHEQQQQQLQSKQRPERSNQSKPPKEEKQPPY